MEDTSTIEYACLEANNGEIEENISVSVRVRPLNEREKNKKDSSVWKVRGEDTIMLDAEGYAPPSSYRFGVFLHVIYV